MKKQSENTAIDGRRLRSQRSKHLILCACESLLQQGQLVPTAQMISDEAGVPIRSFFRHFPDMETLFQALDETLKPKYEKLFSQPPAQGSLHERIAAALKLHADAYESNIHIYRSTKAQLWRYEALQRNYARAQKRLRKDLDVRIPELIEVSADSRELIDTLASFETWARLRDMQKLSRKRAIEIILASLESIIKGEIS